MTKTAMYTLSDGQVVTIADVMKITGLSYTGASSRLTSFSKPEDVFGPRKQQGIPKGTTLPKIVWSSAPSKVCWGIQYEAEWEDGRLNEISINPIDRYGNIMTSRQALALNRYRDKLRKESRDSTKNILNKEKDDE